MKQLLALLLFLPYAVVAQVPTYVPAEGLVAWYPMNNSGSDNSGNGFDGEVIGSTFTTDRFGAEASSAYFDWAEASGYGNPWHRIEINPGFDGYLEGTFSVAAWINPEHYYWPQNSAHSAMIFGYASRCPNTAGLRFSIEGEGALRLRWGNNAISDDGAIVLNEWQHVVGTISTDSMRVYINGIQVGSAPAIEGPTSGCFNIGELHQANGHWYYFDGAIDDLGVWNAALTEEEIAALYNAAPPLSGCSDPEACNYDDTANANDGTCEYGCLYCGEGTVWDSTLQECVTDLTFPTAPCGEGTVWDPVDEECIIAIPADLNYDGCVTVNDLLVLLAVHGTCPPYPEWPDVPNDTSDCPPGAIDQLQQDLNGEGWSWLGEYNTAQYFVSTNPISWDDAQSLAVAYGGHLVVIESQDENDWISTSVGDDYIWIGLYQDTASAEYSEPAGGWAWVNGAEVTYSNWAGNAPNEVNGLENACQMYSSGQWNDAPGDYFLDGSDGRDIYAVIEFSSACPTPDWTCGAPLTYWDYDYATVLIGDQCWFAENLRTMSYADGTEIPEVTDNEDWTDLTTGAFCSYANDPGNVAVYGLLYNWFAVQDIHGLCPSGWHVPTDGEWTGLENHIGSQGFSGNEGTTMKSTTGWGADGNGTDDFGFSAIPGGRRYYTGPSFGLLYMAYWWSSTPSGPHLSYYRSLDAYETEINRIDDSNIMGFSVRCIKD